MAEIYSELPSPELDELTDQLKQFWRVHLSLVSVPPSTLINVHLWLQCC
jgi:hypothetical protein